MSSSRDRASPATGRVLRLATVAALLGGLLALAPLPKFAVATAMETETRRPDVVPAVLPAADQAPVPPTTASSTTTAPTTSTTSTTSSASTTMPSSTGPRPVPGRSDGDGHDVERTTGWRTAREDGLAPFVMIGATTDLGAAPAGPDDAPELLARVRTDGRWSEWFDLHRSSDHAPDAGSPEAASAAAVAGPATEPVWIGRADAYELRVPDGVEQVDVHLVREADREVTITVDESAGAAPAIRSRSAWGARAPSAGPFYAPDLHMAVVHHSAGATSYSSAQVPGIIRAMQAYHMDANGWYDLAYNFVVDRFGVVWEGRGGGTRNTVIGGHSAGFNTGTVGVVVLGDFTGASPPAAALNAVGEVIAWKFAVHGVDPASTFSYTTAGSSSRAAGTYTFPRVVGHRDVGATACPGARLYSSLGTIRARVNGRYAAHLPERPRVVFGVDLGGDGRTEVVRYRPGGLADELWRPDPTGRLAAAPLTIGGTYRPVVGDFDGDGRGDVFWHGTGSTQDHLWYGAPGNTFTPVLFDVRGSFTPFVGDFDGNGADDIYWYAPGLAPDVIWYGNANRVRHSVNRSVPHSAPPFVGDFDGDGIDDIFWYQAGSTPDLLWYGNPNRTFESHQFTVNSHYVPIPGDFDGDSLDDIIWYGIGGNIDFLWTAAGPRGALPTRTLSIGGMYRPITLDAAADGATDVVWYAPGPPLEELWAFAPGGARSTTTMQVGLTYDVVVGDLDGDGHDDLVWSSSSLSSSYRWHGGPDGSLTPMAAG